MISAPKRKVKLAEIKIPIKFQNNKPDPSKLLEKAFDYIVNRKAEPLLVDQHYNLLSGYYTYLIYKSLLDMGHKGYEKVKVCIAEIRK